MAFRATQALRMVVKKTSTGLVGLAVDVNGRANFIAMQRQILDKIKVRLLFHDARNVLDAQGSNSMQYAPYAYISSASYLLGTGLELQQS